MKNSGNRIRRRVLACIMTAAALVSSGNGGASCRAGAARQDWHIGASDGGQCPPYSGVRAANDVLMPSIHPLAGIFHVSENIVTLSPAVQVISIIGGTLISEDITCVTVGTLISHRKIPWVRGGLACFMGIYIGDLLFFFLGRVAGSRLLKYRFFSRTIGEQRLREFGAWFDRRPWAAIMACRFLPGIRVPLYVSVGAVTKRTWTFFWWTCFFAFVWTPALIGGVVLLGDAITGPLEYIFGRGWWTIPLTIAVIVAIVRLVFLLSTAEGRKKLAGWIKRPFAGKGEHGNTHGDQEKRPRSREAREERREVEEI